MLNVSNKSVDDCEHMHVQGVKYVLSIPGGFEVGDFS